MPVGFPRSPAGAANAVWRWTPLLFGLDPDMVAAAARVWADPSFSAAPARMAAAAMRARAAVRSSARWSVALALGLRQGEALGLTWEDVDLDHGALTIRRALQRQTCRGLVLVAPKSRAGRRVIPLPKELVQALRTHRTTQMQERLRAGSMWHDRGFVFASPTGTPVDPRNDHATWKRLLVAAGVKPARLHDARHTAATLLLTQGVPARVAMEILGHSPIGLTLGTYTHVALELSRDATSRVADAL